MRFEIGFFFTLWPNCGKIFTLFSEFSTATYFAFLTNAVLCKTFVEEMEAIGIAVLKPSWHEKAVFWLCQCIDDRISGQFNHRERKM